MAIALFLNGNPAPATFQIGRTYTLSVKLDGQPPVRVEWSLGRRGESKRSGVGDISFSPGAAEPHYLHVIVTRNDGRTREELFILQGSATAASSNRLSVAWSDPLPAANTDLTASISLSGPLPAQAITWSLLYNNVPVQSGSGHTVKVADAQPGILRVIATALDAAGNTLVADSSVTVLAAFGLQSAIVPPQPATSLLHLGSIFSPLIEVATTQCSYLPYELASLTDSLRLLPGTTHFSVDIEPGSSVDDEVVVRTQLGNWTLKGPPGGLTDESLPYDYQHGMPFQPAPMDLSVRYTAEVWNVHGSLAAGRKFKLRFNCYSARQSIYRYEPCDWSSYRGGHGERQRRMFVVFSRVDVELDAESPQNRGGSREVETFTAPEATRIPGTFDTSGAPDQRSLLEDHFYTDQNAAAVYESPAGCLQDFKVHVAHGNPGSRPCYVDFTQPAKPRIVHRIKRLHGKMLMYLAGGALSPNTVLTARVYRGSSPGYVDVPVTVTQNVYNPHYHEFLKVGEAAVDISDFEFDRLGLFIDLFISEASAGTVAPSYIPLAYPGEPYYYTNIKAPAVKADSACFRNPVLVPVYEGTFVGSATPLPDCNTLRCGPVGLYCYTAIIGTGSITVPQPFGFPAPFVAPVDNLAKCYNTPVFVSEIFTESGSLAVQGYSGAGACGKAVLYNACLGTLSPQPQLVVLYPVATTPHAYVSYANASENTCYGVSGTVTDIRPYPYVGIADVTPVSGCSDDICNEATLGGDAVVYQDMETQKLMSVVFPRATDLGVAYYGVAPERFSTGYDATPPGRVNYQVHPNVTVPLLALAEEATIRFVVEPAGIWRELVVTRGEQRLRARMQPGHRQVELPLRAGDRVALEFGAYGRIYQHTNGHATWEKVVVYPKMYDSCTVSFAGAQALIGIGFTGLTNRDDYVIYETFPADVQMALPNPDAIVTVKDSSALPEMVVIRSRATGEQGYSFDLPGYSGQALTSPVTFKFYSGRKRSGAHGEMDVWFAEGGDEFPDYLKVSPYKALQRYFTYRKVSHADDIQRRGLRVTDVTSAAALRSPRVFIDDRGRRLSAAIPPAYGGIYEGGHVYAFSGTLDTGISENLFRAGSATLLDADAAAFLAAVGLSDAQTVTAINTFVLGIKTASLWDKGIACYPWVGGTAAAHSVNLFRPGTYNITWGGTPVHNALGIIGNGTNSYGDTGYAPGVQNFSVMLYSQSQAPTSDKYWFGSATFPTISRCLCFNNTGASVLGGAIFVAGTILFNSVVTSDCRGFLALGRTSASELIGRLRSTNVVWSGATYAGLGNAPATLNFLCRHWPPGSGFDERDSFSNVSLSFGAMFRDLSAADFVTMEGLVNQLQAALGRSA